MGWGGHAHTASTELFSLSFAIQGVSGQIALGPDGNPIDKAIVILYVDPQGHVKMEPIRVGRFLK